MTPEYPRHDFDPGPVRCLTTVEFVLLLIVAAVALVAIKGCPWESNGMAENSAIEWTHHTFNPWRGCSKVSPGCDHCYAETMSKRNPSALGVWGDDGTRVAAAEAYWRQPYKWNAAAKAAGERHRVFCASLADVFEDRPELVAPRRRLFSLIDDTPWLDWLLLTKRPENVLRLTPTAWPFNHEAPGDRGICRNCKHWEDEGHAGWCADEIGPYRYLERVWLGTSVEDQQRADERIPHLLRCPAAVRFLSCEPLLGPVRLTSLAPGPNDDEDVRIDCLAGRYHTGPRDEDGTPDPDGRIAWVIAGGESGQNARPMHPDWARSLRDQCSAAGVAFFFKQWGEWVPTFPFDREGDILLRSDGIVTGRRGERENRRPGPEGPNPFGYRGDGTWADGVTYRTVERDERIGFEFTMGRVGKKAAGRVLDGRTWDEFPTPVPS